VYEILVIDLVQLSERLVDEYNGDKNGETFLREAGDVADQGAEVKGDDEYEQDHHPQADPQA